MAMGFFIATVNQSSTAGLAEDGATTISVHSRLNFEIRSLTFRP